MSTPSRTPGLFRPVASVPAGSGRQGGFSLIVALMMLIVIIILGISASQMAINEERGARNDRDRQLAFQAAEAAIKDAELEIYGDSSPACNLPGEQALRGRMRVGTQTCFNETNLAGYEPGCSGPPNAGLCLNNNPLLPAYLDSANVDFYKDAAGAGNNHTVPYGMYTGRKYPSQLASAAPTSASTAVGTGKPVSIYPPRYIIEAVPKNTAWTEQGKGAGGGMGGAQMFRVTAMGFGANASSQVVLQVVIATQD